MGKHTLSLSTELTEDERADLYTEVEAYIDLRTAEITAERHLSPHVVAHQREAVSDETVKSEDEPEAGDPRPKGSTVTGYRNTITTCPDCGRELVGETLGRTYILACPRVTRLLRRRTFDLMPAAFEIVACGGTTP